jgi:hypothetical protein
MLKPSPLRWRPADVTAYHAVRIEKTKYKTIMPCAAVRELSLVLCVRSLGLISFAVLSKPIAEPFLDHSPPEELDTLVHLPHASP